MPPELTANRCFKLPCMDLWSGNQLLENEVSTPGLEMFVYSRPDCGAQAGGDVYHVSLCVGGATTRILLADVSGHGSAIAQTSQTLRTLMSRYINTKTQTRFVSTLNREFSRQAQAGRFATAIVATYLSQRNRLTICNAGHPRPLWYRQSSDSWSVITEDLVDAHRITNLPLGCLVSAEYQQYQLPVNPGDLLVLYTDAVTEGRDPEDRMLEEAGLLQLTSNIPTESAAEFGQALMQALQKYRRHQPVGDDETIMVLKFVGGRRRLPSVREKLSAYGKLLGLRSI
jgi:serine phosphatase RsbU (regulator of sigma subunit)